MSVSVVITTYNDAQYLERSIRSVLEQTSPPEDIIIVDDGSDDNLAQEIVELKFNERRDILRFFGKPNGGPSSARNFGISKSNSEFIAFLDVDDYWLPNNLARKLEMLKQCPSTYFGVYGSFVDSQTGRVHPFSGADSTPAVEMIGCKKGFPGGAPAYLFRNSALMSVDGFDETLTFNEDFDLVLRLIQAGMHCKGDSYPGYHRNKRTGSLTRQLDSEKKYLGVSAFLSKCEKIETLPSAEIRRRRKVNAFELAKGLRASNAPSEKVKEALTEGFSYCGPANTKEYLAFVYMKFLGVLAHED